MDELFVLLDDCAASAQQPTSRLYRGFVREHRCTDGTGLDALWARVQADQAAGLHAALLADYEWGARLQQAGLEKCTPGDGGALRVLMFTRRDFLSQQQVADWLAVQDGSAAPSPAGVGALAPDIAEARYAQDIAQVRARIRQGETYQLNYTYRLHGTQYGSPLGLYRRLRAMQPVPFAALARLPASGMPGAPDWVLSGSPELFVRKQGVRLSTRPMKGTVARTADAAQDCARADWLASDPKNRAENVMIVDLLRNDLGRVSRTGSVRVPALFAIESYATVHQMTSTVESELRPGVAFPELLRALFPCGSITGAPKLHTMDLIAALEASPRGLYCGAIGWVDAPTAPGSVGDFCLSVAIRTLLLHAGPGGQHRATLGVGGGIVLDSTADAEYAETRAKARFLTAMDPGFTLFETLRITRGQARHRAWHLRRLQASAQALGFAHDAQAVADALDAAVAALDATQPWRLRLDLQHDGGLRIQHAALAPLPPGPAGLVLAAQALPASERWLLQHKTSLRGGYDAAIRAAGGLQAFDAVFVSPEGQVTEGARSTLLVRLGGRWFTPALSSGVLAGVLRARLLARCPGLAERVLTLDEVLAADEVRVCSALRGVQRATWLRGADGTPLRV